MNSTKRALIITAIVLNFLYIGLELYYFISGLMVAPEHRVLAFYLVFDFLQIIGYATCAGFLIYSIAAKGIMFRKRYGFYMAALTISLILNLLSAATVILIISAFVSDIVWVKDDSNDTRYVKKENNSKDKNKEIEKLRKMKDDGLISEEEFQEKLLKLL